jgi:hypothetical protein
MNPNSTDQCNFATDVIRPCHVLDFAGIQEQTLMQNPSFLSQLRASRGAGPALHGFSSYAGQTEVYHPFPT